MAKDSLSYIINHVFLPPQLPQKDDYDPDQSKNLIKLCLSGLTYFLRYIPSEQHPQWAPLITMLRDMLAVRNNGSVLDKGKLVAAIQRMCVGGRIFQSPGKVNLLTYVYILGIITLHIVAQNAGLIIRRTPDAYLFEIFELSPKSADVVGSKGRLVRCFPGPAIAVPTGRIQDHEFIQQLAVCICKLDHETPEEALAENWNARSLHDETRDTTTPMFMTDMLVCILRAVGTPHNGPRIYKRTRDDVLWKDTLIP